jgi:hypothetical protein
VADGPGGLLIVDIKDPAAPKIVGSWDSPGESRGLVLRDRLVYLADGSAGLQILDIGTPARPAIIGTLDTDGEAESVVVSGNSVYIADGSGGIKVIDIGTPAGPKLAASLTASGYAQSVSVEGTVLGVGSLYDGGYQLLDISNPRAPAVLFTGKYTMYNESWRVVLKGSQAWIVDYFWGIFALDIVDPRKPSVRGSFFTPSSIVAVCGRDRWAYAVGELSGLQAVDAADPAHPANAGATNIFRGVQNMTLAENTIHVTDRWSVKFFDISDPARPREGKPLPMPAGVPRTIMRQGAFGYLTADNFGFYILDIAEAAGPKIVGSFPLPGFTYGLAISGDYAYLANSDTGLHILDIRNPKAPTEVGALKLEGEPSGLAVRDGIAYVAAGPSGLITVDVKRPASPKVLGAIASDDFSSAVALDGDFAFVADGNAGVKKINIARPDAPQLAASYNTPGEAQHLFLAGKLILVADTYSLLILK